MVNVVLCCVQGMSTGMLVVKMRKAAEKMNLDCEINAYAIAEIDSIVEGADILLLGPQVGFQADSIREKYQDKKVIVIDSLAYGMMDGKKVMESVKEVLGI